MAVMFSFGLVDVVIIIIIIIIVALLLWDGGGVWWSESSSRCGCFFLICWFAVSCVAWMKLS